MTSRHAAYIVVLDEDVREDYAKGILNALQHVKFVASVEPVIADYSFVVARARRDDQWRAALAQLIREGPGGSA